MINRNQYREIANKKKLHKVRKRWLVVSTAFLGALGMGAISSMPIHADTVKSSPVENMENTSAPSNPQPVQHNSNLQQTGFGNTSQATIASNADTTVQRTEPQSTQPQFTSQRNIAVYGAGTSKPESIWTSQSISSTAQVANNTVNSNYTSENSNTYSNQQRFNNDRTPIPHIYSRSYTSQTSDNTIAQSQNSNNSLSKASVGGVPNSVNMLQNKSNNDQLMVKSLVDQYNDGQYLKVNNLIKDLGSVLKANTWGNSSKYSVSSNASKNSYEAANRDISNQNSSVKNDKNLNRQSSLQNAADTLHNILHQNGWHNRHLTANGYHLESNKDDNDNQDISVVGNPVTFNGNVTLHFHNYHGADIKDITVPYSVSSMVGNSVTVIDPNGYLNKAIQGFNTKGYRADNNSADFTHVVQGSEAPKESGNTVTKDYSLNFTKTTPDAPAIDIDTIDYLYNGNKVGNTIMKGANGSQGTVNGAGLNNEYKLTGNNTFTFNNGIHNINVILSHPQPSMDTDIIKYMYNGSQVGNSVQMKGVASTNGIAGVGVPSGYKLADDGSQDFKYNNGTHPVNVKLAVQPKPTFDTDTIEYVYNDSQVGHSIQMKGAPGTAGIANTDIPNGYKLANDDTQKFTFDNGTHTVDVILANPPKPAPKQPVMDTDVIDYVYNNKILGSTVMHGQNGITATADGTNLPSGYKMANDGTSSFAYDDSTHYVNIEPINPRVTDSISFMANGKGIATINLSGLVNTTVDLSKQLPSGYQLAGDTSDKIMFDGHQHNVDVQPQPVKRTASSRIIINYVNENNGMTIHTTPITGIPGVQFNYQQFDNLVPAGGYRFVQINNPVAQFTNQDQVMTVTVKPLGAAESSSSSAPAKPGSQSSSSKSTATSASASQTSKASSSMTFDLNSTVASIIARDTHSNNSNTSSKVAGNRIPNWYGDLPFSSLKSRIANSASSGEPLSNTFDDADRDTDMGRPEESDDYWQAYHNGYHDAETGHIHYAQTYINNPSAYLRGYQSYQPVNDYQNNRYPDYVPNATSGDYINMNTSNDTELDNPASNTSTENSASDIQDTDYPMPAVGSLWADQYEIYEDANGEYIIIDGIKLYWDAQDGQFDLVLTSNGFQKYNIKSLGL